MPVEVPEESYYTLNAAADAAGMDRREFRKLIGPFEMRVGKLPLRLNDQGTETKCIPSVFLHVFEEAALWMTLDKLSEDTAIAHALDLRRPNHFFRKLNIDIKAQQSLLDLPSKLTTAATAIETKLKTPIFVQVKSSDLQPALEAIEKRVASLSRKAIAAILFGGIILGCFGMLTVQRWQTVDQFKAVNTRINDASYQESQHYAALSRQLQQLRARR